MLTATNKTWDTAVEEALETLLINYKVVMGIQTLSPDQINDRLHTKEWHNGDFEAWFEPHPPGGINLNYKCIVRSNAAGHRFIEVIPFEKPIKNIGMK